MNELKPCPFCGNDRIIWALGYGMQHGVMCAKCGACFLAIHRTKEIVAEKWNTRINETEGK